MFSKPLDYSHTPTKSDDSNSESDHKNRATAHSIERSSASEKRFARRIDKLGKEKTALIT